MQRFFQLKCTKFIPDNLQINRNGCVSVAEVQNQTFPLKLSDNFLKKEIKITTYSARIDIYPQFIDCYLRLCTSFVCFFFLFQRTHMNSSFESKVLLELEAIKKSLQQLHNQGGSFSKISVQQKSKDELLADARVYLRNMTKSYRFETFLSVLSFHLFNYRQLKTSNIR